VVEGLKEGKGVKATEDIPSGSKVCNYGGNLLNESEGNQLMECRNNCDYLLEFSMNRKTFFFNHTEESNFTFGKYVNHSSKHPNVYGKVYLGSLGQPEVIFLAKRKIRQGEELCFNYGKFFQGVSTCVSSCRKCCKLQI
jgi:hypothetical protein